MEKYKTVLLDADQTLFDFNQAEENALKMTFLEHSYEFNEEIKQAYRTINHELWSAFEQGKIEKPMIFETRFKKLFEYLGINGDDVQFGKDYFSHLGEGCFLLPDAREICDYLFGKVDMYMVTNGNSKTQYSRLDGSDMRKYFKGIFVSEEVGYQKPMKEYFDYVFEHIPNLDLSKTIIIGDSLLADIQGGINAGIDTCWFNLDGIQNETGNKPTYEITNLWEIKDIIEIEK